MDKETLKDRTKMAHIIANSGADGVIIMRPVSDVKELPDAAVGVPPPYTGMWGYYTRPYGMSGMFDDKEGSRAHGLNERIRVKSLLDGREFLYEIVKIYANQD